MYTCMYVHRHVTWSNVCTQVTRNTQRTSCVLCVYSTPQYTHTTYMTWPCVLKCLQVPLHLQQAHCLPQGHHKQRCSIKEQVWWGSDWSLSTSTCLAAWLCLPDKPTHWPFWWLHLTFAWYKSVMIPVDIQTHDTPSDPGCYRSGWPCRPLSPTYQNQRIVDLETDKRKNFENPL